MDIEQQDFIRQYRLAFNNNKSLEDMHSQDIIDIIFIYENIIDEKYQEKLHDILYHTVIKEMSIPYKKGINNVVKVVKFPTMIYCITLNPPNDNHCSLLLKVVNGLISCKGCKEYFGVFEVSRKNNNNFHTHILFEFNDKYTVQNFIKKFNQLKYIFKIDKIINKVQLLKTLRYFLKEDKLNKGIINNNSLEYFYKLCETEQTLIARRCQTKECNRCQLVHNI